MEWYYAAGSERKGPVSTEQMLASISVGSVKPATLVWNSNLTAWQPAAYVGREVLPDAEHNRHTSQARGHGE